MNSSGHLHTLKMNHVNKIKMVVKVVTKTVLLQLHTVYIYVSCRETFHCNNMDYCILFRLFSFWLSYCFFSGAKKNLDSNPASGVTLSKFLKWDISQSG